MHILDVCAAPGGKSAYIASLTQGGAVIDSWELHPHRAELMKKTFERLGVTANVKVMDGTVRHPELYGKYDAVLIDAPCSGLGVPGKPDARYAKTDAIIDEIAGIQKKLLDACAGLCKARRCADICNMHDFQAGKRGAGEGIYGAERLL